jgi:N6-adenosine-specific RNA methylase IME4
MNFQVIEELKNLIPPLTKEEFNQLEDNIFNDGIRDALVVGEYSEDGNTKRVLIDGHNRLQIAESGMYEYTTKTIKFKSFLDVKYWMINLQIGRRNLNKYQRGVLAMELKGILEQIAKKKEALRKTISQTKAIDTTDFDDSQLAIVSVLKGYKKRSYATPDTLYFVQNNNKVKIGCSSDVDSRLKDITKHLPDAKLIGTCEGGITLEKDLHKSLNEYRLNNEWFELNETTVSIIKAFLPNSDFANIGKVNSRKEAANKFNIGSSSLAKVQKLEEKATPEIKAQLRTGEMSINQAYKEVRKVEKKEELKKKKEDYDIKIENKTENVFKIDIFNTDEKFRVIYADPAWSYNDKQNTPQLGGAAKHYDSMSVSEICALPVSEISEKDSVLFLWVTSPLLEDSFKVIKEWGFKYKTSFIWDKVKHNMGHYNSVRHEILLIATKGSCTPDNKKLFDSVQSIERNDNHSEKPIEFLNIIDTLYGYGDKLEMFCRKIKKDNWYGWGNEI